jgi:hypothetical protein
MPIEEKRFSAQVTIYPAFLQKHGLEFATYDLDMKPPEDFCLFMKKYGDIGTWKDECCPHHIAEDDYQLT